MSLLSTHPCHSKECAKDIQRLFWAVAASTLVYTGGMSLIHTEQPQEPEAPKLQTVTVDFHYLNTNNDYVGYEYTYEQPLEDGENAHKKIMISTERYQGGSLYCELPPASSQYDCQTFESLSTEDKRDILGHFAQSGYFDHAQTTEIPNVFLEHTNNAEIAPKAGIMWYAYTDKAETMRLSTGSDGLATSAYKITRLPLATPRAQEITTFEIDLASKQYCETEQANRDFLEERNLPEENGHHYYRKSCQSLDDMPLSKLEDLFSTFNAAMLQRRHVDYEGTAVLNMTEGANNKRTYTMSWK